MGLGVGVAGGGRLQPGWAWGQGLAAPQVSRRLGKRSRCWWHFKDSQGLGETSGILEVDWLVL